MDFYLGIDYGTKKTGLARAYDDTRVAVAWKIISTDKLKDLILEHKNQIRHAVVGHSLNLDGTENPTQTHINKFLDFLDKEQIGYTLVDERFSTQAALSMLRWLSSKEKSRKIKKAAQDDAAAAASLLQNYLDAVEY